MYIENTPEIETKRLLLRKFTEQDLEDLLALYSDEEVNRFLPWFPIKSTEEMAKYFRESILPCYQEQIAYFYAVTDKTDHRAIGYVHISNIGGSNDLGYALRKEFWHQGMTTEACAALIEHLRSRNFPYITATHDRNNPYSGAVMKKIGMTYRYSYWETWQPKNILVAFRMYQLNLDGIERTYTEYQKKYPYFVEHIL